MKRYKKNKPQDSAPKPKRGDKQRASTAPDFFLVRVQAPDGNQSLLSIWTPLSIMAASSARANHQLETAAQAAQSAVVAHGNKLREATSPVRRPDVASEVRNAASLASRALVEAGGSRQVGAAVRQAVEAGGRLLMPSLESNQTIHLDDHQPEQRDDAAMDQRTASCSLEDAISVALTAYKNMVQASPRDRAHNTATFDNARALIDDKLSIEEVHVAGGKPRRRTSGLNVNVERSDKLGVNADSNIIVNRSTSESKSSRRSEEIISSTNRGDGASGTSPTRVQACPPNRFSRPRFACDSNSGYASANVGNDPSVDVVVEDVVDEFNPNLILHWDDSLAVDTRITKDEYSDVGQLLGIFTPLPKTESQAERERRRDVNMTDVLPRGNVSRSTHRSGSRRGDESAAATKLGLFAAIPEQVSVSTGTGRCNSTAAGDASLLTPSRYGYRSCASSHSASTGVSTRESMGDWLDIFPRLDHACAANNQGSYEGTFLTSEGIEVEAVSSCDHRPTGTTDQLPAQTTKKLSLLGKLNCFKRRRRQE